MRRRITGICLVVGMLLAMPLLAHHSFGAEYDANKPITLTGTITRVELTNPHSHFYLDVKDDKGKVINWKFEGYNPAVLYRIGWKKDLMLKVGDKIPGLAIASRPLVSPCLEALNPIRPGGVRPVHLGSDPDCSRQTPYVRCEIFVCG